MEPDTSPRRVLPPGLGEAVQPVEMDLEMIRGLLGEQASLIKASSSRLFDEAVSKVEQKLDLCLGVMQDKVAAQNERLMSLSEQCQSLELRLHELENAQKVDSSNGMVPTWFNDRHGSEAESEIQLDLVKAKRKKRRGRRNWAAVGKHTEFEQQVLMDAFDEVGETPRDADVAMDQMLVGCTSAVLEPGEQDRTTNADLICLTTWMARAGNQLMRGGGGKTQGGTHPRELTALLLWMPRSTVGVQIWVKNNGTGIHGIVMDGKLDGGADGMVATVVLAVGQTGASTGKCLSLKRGGSINGGRESIRVQ